MDGQNNSHQPGTDLPRPHEANQPAPADSVPMETGHIPAETASQAAELPQTGQISPPPVPPYEPTSATPPQPPPLNKTEPTNIPVITATPDVAEDSDLIEQEWVSKAKAIVESTRDDPHAQNKEINKVKADYIKKRYNKEIKVTTD